MQDVWLLDVKNLKWTETTTTGTLPSARHSMGFVGLPEGKILMFGGVDEDGVALDDLMLLDTLLARWLTLAPSDAQSARPSARYKMGITIAANKRIYIVGGKLSEWNSGESLYSWDNGELDAEYSYDKGNDDVWELQLAPKLQFTWTLLVQSLYQSVCSAEYKDISAAATFCVGFKGLSGIGLASAPDGSLYLLGGNAEVALEPSASPEASNAYADGGTSSYSDGTSGTADCTTASTSESVVYPYANFYKIDPTGEELDLVAFTSLSSEADNLCAASDDTCKQYFGPSPADDITMVADVASGFLVFLHPSTGDWWQCAPTRSSARWVRNNGIVEGRSALVTPTAPTSFFAAIYTNQKLVLIGGGFRDTAFSWNNNQAPSASESSEIANSMALDFTSGRWSDLDSSRILVSSPYGQCSDELICPTGTIDYTKWFCMYSEPTYGMAGYGDGGGSGNNPANQPGRCEPCNRFPETSEYSKCQYAFSADTVTKESCVEVCYGDKSGGRVSPATLRYGHGVAQSPAGPDTLVLFGGTKGNIDNSKTTAQESDNRELISGSFAGVMNAANDLWLYRNQKWSEIAVGLDVPAARSFFGFSVLPHGDGSFILFGGFSVKRLPELSDTWKLTLAVAGESYTGNWNLIEPTGSSPSGRAGLGLVRSNDGKIHLFGGGVFDWKKIDAGTEKLLFRAVIPSEDLHWTFDSATDEWTKLESTGTVPSARCFSGLVKGTSFRETSLFLFGGIDGNGNLLNDLWEYRTIGSTWREISSFLVGQPPSPRLGLGLISDDSGNLYVVGGEGASAGLRDFYKVPLPEDGVELPTSRYEFLQIYDEVCLSLMSGCACVCACGLVTHVRVK